MSRPKISIHFFPRNADGSINVDSNDDLDVSFSVDATDDIISIGKLKKEIDSGDFVVGVFSFDNFSLKLRNPDGKYSLGTPTSIFKTPLRSDTFVRVSYSNPPKLYTELSVQHSNTIRTLGGSIDVFTGICLEDSISEKILEGTISFKIVSLLYYFKNYIFYGSLTIAYSTTTVSNIIVKILQMFFTNFSAKAKKDGKAVTYDNRGWGFFFNYHQTAAYNEANFDYTPLGAGTQGLDIPNFIINDSLKNKSLYEVLNFFLLTSNSFLNLEKGTTIRLWNREAGVKPSVTDSYSDTKNLASGHDRSPDDILILQVKEINRGTNRVFNEIVAEFSYTPAKAYPISTAAQFLHDFPVFWAFGPRTAPLLDTPGGHCPRGWGPMLLQKL